MNYIKCSQAQKFFWGLSSHSVKIWPPRIFLAILYGNLCGHSHLRNAIPIALSPYFWAPAWLNQRTQFLRIWYPQCVYMKMFRLVYCIYHRCQPSRNSRDSPGFRGSVPCLARPGYSAIYLKCPNKLNDTGSMAWELKSCRFHALCCLSSSYDQRVGLSSKIIYWACAGRDSFFLSLKLFFGGWHL